MRDEPLHIEDRQGSRDGVRILKLSGPLVLDNLFDFQAQVRADSSKGLILDFTSVQFLDSAEWALWSAPT